MGAQGEEGRIEGGVLSGAHWMVCGVERGGWWVEWKALRGV